MGTATFEAYVDNILSGPHLDFNAILGPWRDAFGDRVAVYPLEGSQLPQGLLAHFLGVLGIDTHGTLLDEWLPRENVRCGAKELEVRRLVNIGMSGLGFREKRIRSGRLKFLPALLGTDAPFVGLSDTRIKEIAGFYANSNARFAHEFGIEDAGSLFRDPLEPRLDLDNPTLAEWCDLDPRERRNVCNYVRGVAGIDLEKVDGRSSTSSAQPDLLPPMSSLKKWWLRPSVARLRVAWMTKPLRQRFLVRRARRHVHLRLRSPLGAASRSLHRHAER